MLIGIHTCFPESFETGETANDTTGSGTFIEVMVYFTDPSVNVSPDAQSKPNTATIWPAWASWMS